MVKLNRIYTRTGDDGTTGLADGSRLPKSHLRVAAYGTVDELNSVIGLCVEAAGPDEFLVTLLEGIQHDLFDLGADLATPSTEAEDKVVEADDASVGSGADQSKKLRIIQRQVDHLETAIDERNRKLPSLTSFVLPGGSPASRWLHLARAVCRRAERESVALARQEKVNPLAIHYLNRLSDLLFVCAREANDDGRGDLLWQPGHGRD